MTGLHLKKATRSRNIFSAQLENDGYNQINSFHFLCLNSSLFERKGGENESGGYLVGLRSWWQYHALLIIMRRIFTVKFSIVNAVIMIAARPVQFYVILLFR